MIDVDGHNFPNLPLMKISAYHKGKGDSVEWYEPLFSGHMDKVYNSDYDGTYRQGGRRDRTQEKGGR